MTQQVSSLPEVNGVLLADAQEMLSAEERRQRACTELLRQAATRAGLLPAGDPPPQGGAISEAASHAIETLLDRELSLPEPSEEACRRYHAAHAGRHAVGERVQARHVLFAVTPGVDVVALRRHAEACLVDLRCQTTDTADRFPAVAARFSNCPTGRHGGDLGWLTAEDCAPEFAREIFGHVRGGRTRRAWCTAASACTWWRCSRVSPAPSRNSKSCAPRSRRRCVSRPSPRRCASICSSSPARRGSSANSNSTTRRRAQRGVPRPPHPPPPNPHTHPTTTNPTPHPPPPPPTTDHFRSLATGCSRRVPYLRTAPSASVPPLRRRVRPPGRDRGLPGSVASIRSAPSMCAPEPRATIRYPILPIEFLSTSTDLSAVTATVAASGGSTATRGARQLQSRLPRSLSPPPPGVAEATTGVSGWTTEQRRGRASRLERLMDYPMVRAVEAGD